MGYNGKANTRAITMEPQSKGLKISDPNWFMLVQYPICSKFTIKLSILVWKFPKDQTFSEEMFNSFAPNQ